MSIKLEPGTFSTVPIKMFKGLSAYQQVVFMWLCHHANNESHQCYPSIATLAIECALSKATIKRIIKSLIEKKYLQKQLRRSSQKDENISNLYTVLIFDSLESQQDIDNNDKLDVGSIRPQGVGSIRPQGVGSIRTYVGSIRPPNYNHLTKLNSITTNTLCDRSHNTPLYFNYIELKEPGFKEEDYKEKFEFEDYDKICNMDASETKGKVLNVLAMVVLKHLNWVSKSRFRPVKANLELISHRLKTGVTISDFYALNSYMCKKWSQDVEMSKYIRPKTIYSARNFEQYLGELKTNQLKWKQNNEMSKM